MDKDYTESQACNTVEYLVSKGADVNAKSKYGETPLHTISARAPDAEIIAFLVDKGADVRARSGRGREPIHEVVQFGNVQAVRTLVSLGTDILAKEDDSGHSALHIAAMQNPDVDVVRFLVSQGADIHTKDGRGETLLHAAAHQRDHKAEGREGRNADHARYVVSPGLDIHAKNNKGGTPLHDAAKGNKNEAVFDFLVSKGADADAKDNNGLTPRDLKPRTRPAGARAFFGHMAVRLVPITPNPNPNRNPALEVKAYASVDCTHESALRSREIGRLSGGDSICGLGWRPLGNTSKKSGGL